MSIGARTEIPFRRSLDFWNPSRLQFFRMRRRSEVNEVRRSTLFGRLSRKSRIKKGKATRRNTVEDRSECLEREVGMEEVGRDWKKLTGQEDVDLVSIVTPPATHMEITLAALEHGKAVLCEKPMAMNASQAERMTESARSAGVLALI